MKKLITIVVFASLVWQANAQKVHPFTFRGTVYELNLADSSEKNLKDVTVEVWSGDQLIHSDKTGSKGKYSISLPKHPKFFIKFMKDGFVTKTVEVDTKGFKRAAEFGIVNLDLEISLFRNQNYLGVDFMEYTPVAIARMNKSKGVVEWDWSHTDEVNARLKGIIAANGQ
jgi:hypothetical protein